MLTVVVMGRVVVMGSGVSVGVGVVVDISMGGGMGIDVVMAVG